jgi:hypothetical protein
MLLYSHTVPGIFVQLLSSDTSIVDGALEKLSEIWQWLCKAEVAAQKNSDASSWLQQLIWRSWTLARGTFPFLEEASFQAVPAEMKGALQGLFTRLLTAKLVEDSLKYLKTMSKSTERGALGRKMRWDGLQQSRLLAENDRPKLEIPEGARASAAKALSPSVFDADVQDFSLSMPVLRAISDNKWKSQSPATFAAQPLFLQCCLSVKSWSLVGQAWMSLLAWPGCVLAPKAKPEAALLVLFTSERGCLAWPLGRRVRGTYEYSKAAKPDHTNKQPGSSLGFSLPSPISLVTEGSS